MRLAGTTKTTLDAIRNRTHWNSAQLQPLDPVTLGLCSQIDLDFEVNRAARDRPAGIEDRGPTLIPAEITTGPRETHQPAPVFADSQQARVDPDDDLDVRSVFSNSKASRRDDD